MWLHFFATRVSNYHKQNTYKVEYTSSWNNPKLMDKFEETDFDQNTFYLYIVM